VNADNDSIQDIMTDKIIIHKVTSDEDKDDAIENITNNNTMMMVTINEKRMK
jgi:hypothetical protein